MSLENPVTLTPEAVSTLFADYINGKAGSWSLIYTPYGETSQNTHNSHGEAHPQQPELSGREHIKLGIQQVAHESSLWMRSKISSLKSYYHATKTQFSEKWSTFNEQSQIKEKFGSAKEAFSGLGEKISSRQLKHGAIAAVSLTGSLLAAKRLKTLYA